MRMSAARVGPGAREGERGFFLPARFAACAAPL